MNKSKTKPEVETKVEAKKDVRKTKEYKTWKATLKMSKSFPIEKHTEEVKSLHASRISRTLISSGISTNKLSKATSQDLHVRSRISELSVIAKKAAWDIERTNEAMRDFIFDRGFTNGKTQADRVKSANVLLKKGIDILSSLEYFIEICDDLIEDCDKSAFRLRDMFAALGSASKMEYSF